MCILMLFVLAMPVWCILELRKKWYLNIVRAVTGHMMMSYWPELWTVLCNLCANVGWVFAPCALLRFGCAVCKLRDDIREIVAGQSCHDAHSHTCKANQTPDFARGWCGGRYGRQHEATGRTEGQPRNLASWIRHTVAWEPLEFVKRASGLSHPGHFLDGVHHVLLDLVRRMRDASAYAMALDRAAAMRKWSLRFAELKSQGITALESAPTHAREILQPKNMQLFEEMVRASGSPDVQMAKDITHGFDLGGIFPNKPLHATLTPEQVRDMAPMAREATWNAVRRSRDDPMCREIYDSDIDKCAKGWMKGPFPFDSLPDGAVLTRRFGSGSQPPSRTGVRWWSSVL